MRVSRADTAHAPVFEVSGGRPLSGALRVPGDKSISHRALLLAALADGVSVVRGLSDGDDVGRTAGAIASLGATVDGERVIGGAQRLHSPDGALDMGNSGTGMRLVAGLVAGWSWRVRLVGDASLSSRPMDRVAVPLRLMGASVEGYGPRCTAPLDVHGGNLCAIDYSVPIPSAQVKSAVLLAGLRANGETIVREQVATRPHTEEMLVAFGADVQIAEGPHGRVVRLRPSSPKPFEIDIPGDPSQAAFWLVAACIVPGSEVLIEHVHVGAGRDGFLDVLSRMGADLDRAGASTEDARGAAGTAAALSSPHGGSATGPRADLLARYGPLHATDVSPDEVAGIIDEVPVLAVAAAAAEGTTAFRGLGELRVKESDRLAGVARLVRAFGAQAEVVGDDLVVTGAGHLVPAVIDAGGDHRMAMAAAVAGLAVPVGEGPTTIVGWDAVDSSYPAFAAHLGALRGSR
jgi:3-phosphoshikimate 1-carboxyvinyltransferase